MYWMLTKMVLLMILLLWVNKPLLVKMKVQVLNATIPKHCYLSHWLYSMKSSLKMERALLPSSTLSLLDYTQLKVYK